MLRKLTEREPLTPHLVEQFKIKPADLANLSPITRQSKVPNKATAPAVSKGSLDEGR